MADKFVRVLAGWIAALAEKTSPVLGDWGVINDSGAGNALKTTRLGNIPRKVLIDGLINTDITLGNANYHVLSVAGGEAPSEVASVGTSGGLGAVVAHHTGTFGTHSLDEVVGADPLNPLNLVRVVEATGHKPIISSNLKPIYALLQSEIYTDGHTFNDTTQQVQLSFVEMNAAGTDLVATAVDDIKYKTIHFVYAHKAAITQTVARAVLFANWQQRVRVDDTGTYVLDTWQLDFRGDNVIDPVVTDVGGVARVTYRADKSIVRAGPPSATSHSLPLRWAASQTGPGTIYAQVGASPALYPYWYAFDATADEFLQADLPACTWPFATASLKLIWDWGKRATVGFGSNVAWEAHVLQPASVGGPIALGSMNLWKEALISAVPPTTNKYKTDSMIVTLGGSFNAEKPTIILFGRRGSSASDTYTTDATVYGIQNQLK